MTVHVGGGKAEAFLKDWHAELRAQELAALDQRIWTQIREGVLAITGPVPASAPDRPLALIPVEQLPRKLPLDDPRALELLLLAIRTGRPQDLARWCVVVDQDKNWEGRTKPLFDYWERRGRDRFRDGTLVLREVTPGTPERHLQLTPDRLRVLTNLSVLWECRYGDATVAVRLWESIPWLLDLLRDEGLAKPTSTERRTIVLWSDGKSDDWVRNDDRSLPFMCHDGLLALWGARGYDPEEDEIDYDLPATVAIHVSTAPQERGMGWVEVECKLRLGRPDQSAPAQISVDGKKFEQFFVGLELTWVEMGRPTRLWVRADDPVQVE